MDATVENIALAQAHDCERINNLERWQTAQNGTLQRLEGKMDKLRNTLVIAAITFAMAFLGAGIDIAVRVLC